MLLRHEIQRPFHYGNVKEQLRQKGRPGSENDVEQLAFSKRSIELVCGSEKNTCQMVSAVCFLVIQLIYERNESKEFIESLNMNIDVENMKKNKKAAG